MFSCCEIWKSLECSFLGEKICEISYLCNGEHFERWMWIFSISSLLLGWWKTCVLYYALIISCWFFLSISSLLNWAFAMRICIRFFFFVDCFKKDLESIDFLLPFKSFYSEFSIFSWDLFTNSWKWTLLLIRRLLNESLQKFLEKKFIVN